MTTVLALPTFSQDTAQPFAKSYIDITAEQAWSAAAIAAQELSGVAKNVTRKTDASNEKVEFAQYFVGFPTGKGVRFKVGVSQTADGRVQIAATPTGIKTARFPRREQVESLANQFFTLVDREVGVYWGKATSLSAMPSPFASIRSSLIGVNEVARTALPVWLEPNGETVFPTAFSKAKTGDALTITNIVVCGRYPVREIASECGTEAVGNRLVVVVLFNGAQPRVLPGPRPVQGGNAAAAFGNMLDSFVCSFGKAIDCIQANQRTNIRELERLQSTMQHSSAEASWGMSELQKFEQTGAEIAFQLSGRDFSTQADLSAVIKDHLSRFVEMGSAGILPSNSPTNIAISSTPAGAEIYIDEKFVGNTPSTLNVVSGAHSIVVKKNGFQSWTREMSFSGGTITLSAELVSGAKSSMSVSTSNPMTANATVSNATRVSVQSVEPKKTAAVPAVNSPQGWIGISTKHVGNGGVLITAVTAGGPAAQAGLKTGDVINGVNGIPLKDEDFDAKMAACKSGTKVRIGYMRDSWALEATVTVRADPK